MTKVRISQATLDKMITAATTGRPRKVGPIIYESHIETAIVQAMVLDGWRPFKMQYSFDQVKKLTLGEPGMCDHLFLRYRAGEKLTPVSILRSRVTLLDEVLWWEFKRVKSRPGRRDKATGLDPDQVQWIAAEKAKGAMVWVAGIDHEADIAGAALHYLGSGLCNRPEVFLPLIPPEGRP